MKKILCLCMILVPCLLFAEGLHETISVDLVSVYLTAIDSQERFVTDLKLEEIILKENGVVRPIRSFNSFEKDGANNLGEKGVPLTLVLLLDMSSSMANTVTDKRRIDIVKNAALKLVDELNSDDKMMTVGFNSIPKVITKFTSDKDQLKQDILDREDIGGATALLDAIYDVVEQMEDSFGRKVLVLCSDGEDNSSHVDLEELVRRVVAADITVLSFSIVPDAEATGSGRYVLTRLAKDSGGFAFFAASMDDLGQMMERLKKGMRSQYSLLFTPATARSNGEWRKIEIFSKRSGLKLRYRDGYFVN